MPKKISTIRKLSVGDLVYHLLYGREWHGIILDIKEETSGLASPREIALVAMQPNTEYEFFFKTKVSKKYKICDNMGYVSINWLVKLVEIANFKYDD